MQLEPQALGQRELTHKVGLLDPEAGNIFVVEQREITHEAGVCHVVADVFAIKSNAGALLPINATTLRFLCRGDSNPATAAKGPEP